MRSRGCTPARCTCGSRARSHGAPGSASAAAGVCTPADPMYLQIRSNGSICHQLHTLWVACCATGPPQSLRMGLALSLQHVQCMTRSVTTSKQLIRKAASPAANGTRPLGAGNQSAACPEAQPLLLAVKPRATYSDRCPRIVTSTAASNTTAAAAIGRTARVGCDGAGAACVSGPDGAGSHDVCACMWCAAMYSATRRK
jgi:hypothetical protein